MLRSLRDRPRATKAVGVLPRDDQSQKPGTTLQQKITWQNFYRENEIILPFGDIFY